MQFGEFNQRNYICIVQIWFFFSTFYNEQLEHKNVIKLVLVTLWGGVEEGKGVDASSFLVN